MLSGLSADGLGLRGLKGATDGGLRMLGKGDGGDGDGVDIGAGYRPIEKSEPSVGTDRVKNASSGGAPWNVRRASNWRVLGVGRAWRVVKRRKRTRVGRVKGVILRVGWLGD